MSVWPCHLCSYNTGAHEGGAHDILWCDTFVCSVHFFLLLFGNVTAKRTGTRWFLLLWTPYPKKGRQPRPELFRVPSLMVKQTRQDTMVA